MFLTISDGMIESGIGPTIGPRGDRVAIDDGIGGVAELEEAVQTEVVAQSAFVTAAHVAFAQGWREPCGLAFGRLGPFPAFPHGLEDGVVLVRHGEADGVFHDVSRHFGGGVFGGEGVDGGEGGEEGGCC